jgi:hypothetical protein
MALAALEINVAWTATSFITPKMVAGMRNQDPNLVSRHSGELKLVFSADPIHGFVSEADIDNDVCVTMITQFGSLKAAKRDSTQARVYRFEFTNTLSTERALMNTGGVQATYGVVFISLYQPDLDNAARDAALLSAPIGRYNLLNGGRTQASLTGRSVLPAGMTIGSSTFGQLSYAGHRRRALNDNHIDTVAIENGEDVRTTIMLRNIPNRVDIHMLKEIIDRTSKGKYDFVYLRIDFQNRCNVGYAFINFSDALSIIPFANARQGVRWEVFDSDKIAELSYASGSIHSTSIPISDHSTAIQNRENLIQKFRNSSVMLENPDYRPKVGFALSYHCQSPNTSPAFLQRS